MQAMVHCPWPQGYTDDIIQTMMIIDWLNPLFSRFFVIVVQSRGETLGSMMLLATPIGECQSHILALSFLGLSRICSGTVYQYGIMEMF